MTACHIFCNGIMIDNRVVKISTIINYGSIKNKKQSIYPKVKCFKKGLRLEFKKAL